MGEIDFNAQGDITIGGDVVGRDKITNTFTNIEAAAPLALNLHQLPPPPRDFTGRAAELDELMAAVEKGGVIIWGTAGVGKTTLALKLAELLVPRYPDAQFYLDLKGTSSDPLPAADAMAHIIHGFYPDIALPKSDAEVQGQYRSILYGKRALLLMDNAWNDTQVEQLVPPATCCLLVTSRQHFTLPGLEVEDLAPLPSHDASELLLTISPRIGKQAEAIAKLCGCLPFALRIAGKTLAERIDFDPAEYSQWLTNAQSRSRLDLIDPSLRLSYRLLTPEMQKFWCMLAVFPDTFDREAAAVVWEVEPNQARDALSELVRYSLADYSPPSSTSEKESGAVIGRYRLHDLGRLFADKHLSDFERYEAQKRHAAHYETLLHSANELYQQGSESIKRGLALFDLEWPNIRAGQAWAEANAGKDDSVARVCNAYPDWPYLLDLRQHPRERIRWLETALAAARRLKNRQMEGVHLGNLGLVYADLGDARKAIEFYDRALVIDREIGDRRGEGNALGNLGNAYHVLGDTRKAIEFYDQALVIDREIGDRRGEGNALSGLGLAHAGLGNARKAIEFHEQVLGIAREIGDQRGEGADLGNLGNAYHVLGDARKAIEFHEQALVIDREIGDRRGEGADLGNLGIAYKNLGDARKAIEFYEQALAIDREISDRRGEATDLWNMSVALDDLGERAQAIAHAEAALKIKEEIEDPWAEKVRKKLAEWQRQ